MTSTGQPVWPPPDLAQIEVHLKLLPPGDGSPLFDSDAPGAVPPARDAQLLVLVQPDVPTDGVSEAGLHGSRIQALFSGFPNAEVRFVDDILNLDPSALREDGRPVVLVSTHRMRYPQAARDWPVSLHLSVWNPFQALDLPVPTVVTWGYADGAMAGLEAWLHGRHGGSAQSPVNLG